MPRKTGQDKRKTWAAPWLSLVLLANTALWPAFLEVRADQGAPADAQSALIAVRVGDAVIRVEIADDPESHLRGLMGRETLAPDTGMLFVYPRAQPLAFWMKNTPLDLDIGFFDSQGRLLNIEAMIAYDEVTRHRSQGPARYALETPRDWFSRNAIQPGARLRFPPQVSP